MTPITKENLTRHEVIGLQVCVIQSSNQTHVGIKGKVIAEMKNMFIISDGTKKRWIAKDSAVYCFSLPDKSLAIVNGK
ncbi:ribonuclease P protein subunit, partial [Candidatus Bathyarchaeota archaeon]|nr:ribonuclease P protein subunit [Candidatus Bathyarchaeota archaeon]